MPEPGGLDCNSAADIYSIQKTNLLKISCQMSLEFIFTSKLNNSFCCSAFFFIL